MAARVDDFERRAGEGPCIDAIEEETPQIETDLTAANLWPKLAAILVEETPVRGAMGFRILVDKRKGAALNLFSRTPNLFDLESAGQAAVLASFTSVAINAVARGEDATTLATGAAQQPRDRQGRRHADDCCNGISEEDAFDVLRRHSQTLNIKLADVARAVIETRGKLLSDDEGPPSPTTGLFGQPQLGLLDLFDVDVLEGDHPHLLDEPSRPVHVPYPGIGQPQLEVHLAVGVAGTISTLFAR